MRYQFGATLAVTLILLFVLTILGLSAIQVTLMQEKMSSTVQDKELSFNAAESALAAGEAWLLGLSTQPSVQTACASQPCIREAYQNLNYTTQTKAWWDANAASYTSSLKNVATAPHYLIEFKQFVPDSPIVGDSSVKSTGTFYYQITARGTGTSDSSVSILQTTVGRRF